MTKTKKYTWDQIMKIKIPHGKILAWWSDDSVTFLNKDAMEMKSCA